ncbi:hypothetical protein BJY04DRAFT_226957 [Aspergillus karnatakaensis]|uniref:NmrA/HSCARG family protein n=1 Tax=Aspergillus karnatakaensis TaxID=1810916 RepID=UPI003CCDDDE8
MSNLVVFGATGQQGNAILTTILDHPTLSKKYSLRGITRDASKPKAKDLAAKGIEIVEADLNSTSTLPAALREAHTVIIITETVYEANGKALELQQGKTVADACVAAGVENIIFSTAVHCNTLWSGGPVDQFDVKAEIEAYIRTLPLKSSFFAPGMFMQNLATMMRPHKQDDGTYLIAGVNDPSTKIPMIETPADTGEYIVPLLEDPVGMNGRVMYAGSELRSFSEMAEIISKASGKTVKYQQIPSEVYAGFMEKEMGWRVVAMMKFFDSAGYFGPGTEEKLRETLKLVKGRLTGFEEFATRVFTDL